MAFAIIVRIIKEKTVTSLSFKYLLRKTNHGLSLLIFFFLIVFCGANSLLNAMIKDISLEELVKRSDVIVVADVLAIKEVGSLPSGVKVIANLVRVDQPLLGTVAIGEKLKLKTRGVEDNAVFKKGMKTLLFLKRVNNYYEVVSGIAGSWPITNEGQIAGYGTGKSFADVEKAIEKKEIQKESGKNNEPKSNKAAETIGISI